MVHKPSWFQDGKVFVSYAPTCEINKDGADLYKIDSTSGKRTPTIDDELLADVTAVLTPAHDTTSTSRWINSDALGDRLVAVPNYFDTRPEDEFEAALLADSLKGFASKTLGEIIDEGWITARYGHGSPSADLRQGTVPYIKVSDIRGGQVNINPSNRVSTVIARQFWRADDSGLAPFDLITPIRTSKNIGEFAFLMPDQENVVLTKEILVLHATGTAPFDQFYLFWALALKSVRRQWDRLVFMQTNREDVGMRYRELRIPIAPTRKDADRVSQPFKQFYEGTETLRQQFRSYLDQDELHHVFLATSAVAAQVEADEETAELDVASAADNADDAVGPVDISWPTSSTSPMEFPASD